MRTTTPEGWKFQVWFVAPLAVIAVTVPFWVDNVKYFPEEVLILW
jgi:hypothetical protein